VALATLKLVMYVAELVYANKLKAGGSFTTPIGKFPISAKANPTTGDQDTIIFF
jgi:hypothetical protein